jgi:hypothetical protein
MQVRFGHGALQAENGQVIYLAEEIPDWLARMVGR